MSTTPKQFVSFQRVVNSPFIDPKTGMLTKDAARKLQEYENKLGTNFDLAGALLAAIQAIAADASVAGRGSSLQTILQNLQDSGAFNSLGNVTDTSTDHLTDGTGTPLTGGKRGAQALDSNNRLVSSFHQNQVDVTASPTSSTGLANDGTSTVITVPAGTYQYGPGTVSYNSGSVDPGVFGGPDAVYFDDPTFSGGAVGFQFSTSSVTTIAALGRQVVGSITTVNGTAKTGGGFSGGTGGKSGGRGYNTL